MGDGVLGMGPNPQIPNPQSPIPNPQSPIPIKYIMKIEIKNILVQINKYY
jgi:hypothetical protein